MRAYMCNNFFNFLMIESQKTRQLTTIEFPFVDNDEYEIIIKKTYITRKF